MCIYKINNIPTTGGTLEAWGVVMGLGECPYPPPSILVCSAVSGTNGNDNNTAKCVHGNLHVLGVENRQINRTTATILRITNTSPPITIPAIIPILLAVK